MNLHLLSENLLFLGLATTFLAIVGWAWRNTKPYHLPHPLPSWFKLWFLTVQMGGGVLPLVGLTWSVWQGFFSAAAVLAWYFILLILQVLSESLALRQFQSTVFVMVPYLYLPYRIWQLYEGLTILHPVTEIGWIQTLLLFEIVLWIANYALDLAQLPRLLHWAVNDNVSHDCITRNEN